MKPVSLLNKAAVTDIHLLLKKFPSIPKGIQVDCPSSYLRYRDFSYWGLSVQSISGSKTASNPKSELLLAKCYRSYGRLYLAQALAMATVSENSTPVRELCYVLPDEIDCLPLMQAELQAFSELIHTGTTTLLPEGSLDLGASKLKLLANVSTGVVVVPEDDSHESGERMRLILTLYAPDLDTKKSDLYEPLKLFPCPSLLSALHFYADVETADGCGLQGWWTSIELALELACQEYQKRAAADGQKRYLHGNLFLRWHLERELRPKGLSIDIGYSQPAITGTSHGLAFATAALQALVSAHSDYHA